MARARRLGWLITLPIFLVVAAVLVLFSINNRGAIALDLWPFAWQVEAPLYLLVLAPLFTGILIGALLVSLSGLRTRMVAKRSARDVRKLSAKVETLEAERQSQTAVPPAAPDGKALTSQSSTGQPPPAM